MSASRLLLTAVALGICGYMMILCDHDRVDDGGDRYLLHLRTCFWTAADQRLALRDAAAGAIALINSIGNLAGFGGPYLIGWVKEDDRQPPRRACWCIAAALARTLIWFSSAAHETKARNSQAWAGECSRRRLRATSGPGYNSRSRIMITDEILHRQLIGDIISFTSAVSVELDAIRSISDEFNIQKLIHEFVNVSYIRARVARRRRRRALRLPTPAIPLGLVAPRKTKSPPTSGSTGHQQARRGAAGRLLDPSIRYGPPESGEIADRVDQGDRARLRQFRRARRSQRPEHPKVQRGTIAALVNEIMVT